MADASEPPPMTPQQAEEATQAATAYLQDNYGQAHSVWDPAWLVLLNPGHLRPAFSVDDRTHALVELEIERKEDLELLVNGSAFATEALADSADAAEQLAGQAVIPAPRGAGRRANRHHYELPVVRDGDLRRATGEDIKAFRIVEHTDPHPKLDAALRRLVSPGVNLADSSTWPCPGTPCCDGTPHYCGCGRRHFRHKKNQVVMKQCAQCWNRAACQKSNQHKAEAAGVTRPHDWPADDAITEASGYWFGFV
ncbi:hypothetical protein B484DRAFT_461255 [Ochromonadaceae sp. CCMP2298]|nr:hypothetical protein B484DRAFT_461255 [Ochromonadaceae sp. CCMP2298]